MTKSSAVDGRVQARVESITACIRDVAAALADEAKITAEARGQELFDSTVANVRDKLAAEYEREEGEIQKNLKIREAQIKNNVKLEILKAQTEAIHEALNQSIVELCEFSSGPEYAGLLRDLIAEGLDRLKEPRVRLMVRKSDLATGQRVLADAVRIAERLNPGLAIKAKFDESRFLAQAPSCAGGVVLIAQKGKIRVSNVLNDRLRLAYEGMLPQVRALIAASKRPPDSYRHRLRLGVGMRGAARAEIALAAKRRVGERGGPPRANVASRKDRRPEARDGGALQQERAHCAAAPRDERTLASSSGTARPRGADQPARGSVRSSAGRQRSTTSSGRCLTSSSGRFIASGTSLWKPGAHAVLIAA
jgi:V-type H+-transporting ATPase subunit E